VIDFEGEPAPPLAERRIEIARLLGLYELEKAIYELDNRPDWASIPAAGIERMLEGV
jgi:predicted trehalose synthase